MRKLHIEFPLDSYDQDGLVSCHNHDFMSESAFCSAYQRGVQAVGQDYKWHWRVHVGLWAAFSASKLRGDFVECGVNKGFLSSSIMQSLSWDSLGKMFFLLDTFQGIDARYVTKEELASGILKKNEELKATGFYADTSDEVRENFSEWKNVRIIEGVIPETLEQVDAEQVAFLHIDLNCAPPEIAALNYFWDRLVPGAIVLLDDYAYRGYLPQKLAMDELAEAKGVKVVSLPTGQGLLIKPAVGGDTSPKGLKLDDEVCPVCGGTERTSSSVLWSELIDAWQLSPAEVVYINEQQGTQCVRCHSNVRSMALGLAIGGVLGGGNTLMEVIANQAEASTRVLEVNEAGALHPCLSRLSGHILASHPEFDLMRLPFEDGSFDMVVHSDTLEHIPDPMQALRECWRVLDSGGALIFTVPVVVGRMTCSKAGLPSSYHGSSATGADDLLVHTEYGADVWTSIIRAGFRRCEIVTHRYPAGIAWIARK